MLSTFPINFLWGGVQCTPELSCSKITVPGSINILVEIGL